VVDDLPRPGQQVDRDDRVHLPVRLRVLPEPRAAGGPLPVRLRGDGLHRDDDPDLLWTPQEGVGNRNVFAVGQVSYDG
jgi:hypothetical protein